MWITPPGDSCVAAGVPPIQLVSIVEEDGGPLGRLGRLCPLQDLLGPVHPHVAVHPSQASHLQLGSIPEAIVGAGLLHILPVIEILATVSKVLFQGLSGPGGKPLN